MGTKLDQHFVDIGACQSGRDWVAENCATSAECWKKLLDEGRVDWALWWYVRDRGFDDKVAAVVRRMVMRSVEYAAKAMGAATLPEQARTLRAIPCTATFAEIRYAACWSAANANAAYAAANAYAAARIAAAAADAANAAYAAAYAAANAYAADAANAAANADAAAAAANANVAANADAAADEQKKQIADILELLECPWTEATI